MTFNHTTLIHFHILNATALAYLHKYFFLWRAAAKYLFQSPFIVNKKKI